MGRIPALEAVRGMAALMVVAFHVSVFHATDGVPQQGWLHFTSYGWLGVQVFFVLSGLVLYVPYARGVQLDVRGYATRRLLRIVPALWVALAISTAASGLWTTEALRHALFLNPHPSETTSAVAPAWSLTIEMGFYALLPALVWLFARRPRYRLPVLVALLWTGIVARLLYTNGWPMTPFTFVDNFAAGMLAAIVIARVRLPRWTLVVGAAAFAAAFSYMAAGPRWATSLAVVGLLFAATLCTLGAVNPHVPRLLVWLGTVSYGIYLWHWPILLALHDRGLYRLPDPLEIAAVSGLAALAGWASWRLVERPAMRLRDHAIPHRAFSQSTAAVTSPLANVDG